MAKDAENYDDLLKVPDSIIIKSLRTEAGKLHSYIIELEDRIKGNLESNRITNLEKVLAKKNKIIKHIQQQSDERQVEVQKLMHQVFSLKNPPININDK